MEEATEVSGLTPDRERALKERRCTTKECLGAHAEKLLLTPQDLSDLVQLVDYEDFLAHVAMLVGGSGNCFRDADLTQEVWSSLPVVSRIGELADVIGTAELYASDLELSWRLGDSRDTEDFIDAERPDMGQRYLLLAAEILQEARDHWRTESTEASECRMNLADRYMKLVTLARRY